MLAEIELFESPDLIPLDFCLWGWMKREVYLTYEEGSLLNLLAPELLFLF